MQQRSWFHLSFCQGWTTATLCWQASRKIGWIACREYKTMQLVLFLADESETMQTLCSDLCIGCQSELGLSTRLPPCAIVAEIHLLLLTSLIFSQSINLPALYVLQTLVSWLFHASYSTNMESVLSQYIGPVTWNSLPKPLCEAPSLPSFKSNLKTFLFKKHLYWWLSQACWAKLSFLYICISCVARAHEWLS